MLTFVLVAYVFASAGFGLIATIFTRSRVAAVFATMIVAMLSMVRFSGLRQPVATLHGAVRIMEQFRRASSFMKMSVCVFGGLEFGALGLGTLLIVAVAPIFAGFAALLLKKQES
jgi:ribosome-dependent ATPase